MCVYVGVMEAYHWTTSHLYYTYLMLCFVAKLITLSCSCNSAFYPHLDGKRVVAYGLLGESLVWLIGWWYACSCTTDVRQCRLWKVCSRTIVLC